MLFQPYFFPHYSSHFPIMSPQHKHQGLLTASIHPAVLFSILYTRHIFTTFGSLLYLRLKAAPSFETFQPLCAPAQPKGPKKSHFYKIV